jgi:hypothetical protein
MIRLASTLAKLGAPLTVAAWVICLSACGPSEPVPERSPPDLRRLTEEQYRNIIADVFGSAIVVGGRFDSPVRTEGLLAVGARQATVTPGGLIQFDDMARSIAAQVLGEPNRHFLVPCPLATRSVYDAACTAQFIGKFGRLLFRRPLTEEELGMRQSIVQQTTEALASFSDGLAAGLASLLVAPQFLFVTDLVESDPQRPDDYRLDAFSIASRLSFLLWNTAPDDVLLKAAESGELHTDPGLKQQVARMIASPRLVTGVRAFFSDMLGFSEFDFLEKDSVIYPAFGVAAARDAKEQTLRTITDHVITRDLDYRDLFVTRKTFMTRTLGLVYRVQVDSPKGVWEPYEFPVDDVRAGIQSQLSFLALNSHPGRSSPTLRGKAIREMLLCQKVPAPPPDVDFSVFNDPDSPNKTARERLSAHATNAACAGCHRLTDPLGLAMENFDGAGQLRALENGAMIDSSGTLDGIEFQDGSGLGPALRDNPAATSCLVNRLYAYASGESLATRDPWLAYLEDSFAADDFRVMALLQRIATSKTYYAVTPPAAAAPQTDSVAKLAAGD